MNDKNNFHEHLKRIQITDKKDRFSIKKLMVGITSVILGFNLFSAKLQEAEAESIDSEGEDEIDLNDKNVALDKQVPQASTSKQSKRVDVNVKSTAALSAKKAEYKLQLSTFSGLTMFLRENAAQDTQKVQTRQASSVINKPDVNRTQEPKQLNETV
ncbi:YSIRK-type signal peptide-containing protein [Lactobacillus sp. ESL0791]|uniref:YSIRK-type signal peptide-containing protein n=1 Tax=Lactobacillus sp. ESL0791 TaxID=2983234 RepID=UPI0023F8E402|nr:YSIRK-type signal peptide-containing protein [Lactobacillus sp. ESL0791]MDF7639338.1 YSIRK-type signal peptide-containing protein [Lactobacillus sp. ESL0791]